MTNIYGKYNDGPNQIKNEGQEIVLKFKRNGDGTATVSWNIPPPSNGCDSSNQAYDGIVITVSDKPANYISTSPKNAKYYSADPTADADMHAGDKLDGARVIGAFYNDKTTTSLTITDVLPKTAYYVSGYAVDSVARYHREGVHAYSLPTGTEESNGDEDRAAIHDIQLDTVTGITPLALTGLVAGTEYGMSIKMDCKKYDITINGVDAQTYADLVKELNRQFFLLQNPHNGPFPPNADRYYIDKTNLKFYYWDGFTNEELSPIISAIDPTQPIEGTYWLDPTGPTLYLYENGQWEEVTVIFSPFNPLEPYIGLLWFDGTDVWEWSGSHWCKLCVYIQEQNPSLPRTFSNDTYWFDQTNNLFFEWDHVSKVWKEKLVIVTPNDPNLLNTGDYWYDETEEKVKLFVGGEWNTISTIRYSERDGNGELPSPAVPASYYWYIPSEAILYQRNLMNTDWEEVPFVSYPTDPRDRKSCDLWWNTSPSVNDLYAWDEVNERWSVVTEFLRQANDPAIPEELPECAVWYNPVTKKLKKITDITCTDVFYINTPFDPTNPPFGVGWINLQDMMFATSSVDGLLLTEDGNPIVFEDGITLVIAEDGSGEIYWADAEFILSTRDPFLIEDGEYWYDTESENFYQYRINQLVQLPYSTSPVVPNVGVLWYDSTTDSLKEWNGSTWTESLPFAYAEFVMRTCRTDRESIRFYTRNKGCGVDFEVLVDNNTIFSNLSIPVIYTSPVNGQSALLSGAMYEQIGVGTDGSPDERRKLHDYIKTQLGHPSVAVELTKEAIDNIISNALGTLRKRSNLSYTRAMFFLDLRRNQQTYRLTDQCVGFHKIVNITSIHRMRSAAFKTAFAQNDNFAFAALQQLYHLGTFDILTFHMSSAYIEELETLFASRIMFQWVEDARELKIYQSTADRERVLVDAIIEKTEQQIITGRETQMWVKRWCIAEAKMTLAQTRGKFQTLPGPNGSTTLNSQELITQGEAEKAELMAELDDMMMQDAVDIGMRSHFILG